MARKAELASRAHEHEKRIAALDAAIARGIADAEAGRVKPVATVFDGLETKYRRAAAANKRSKYNGTHNSVILSNH